jgi:hypothetical protein
MIPCVVVIRDNVVHDNIILEYVNHSQTMACIRRAALHYKHKRYVEKWHDDGSNEVMRVIRIKNWPQRFLVCGVNTNACVRQTALGLGNYGRVVVYLPGCNDYYGPPWPLNKDNCVYSRKQVIQKKKTDRT